MTARRVSNRRGSNSSTNHFMGHIPNVVLPLYPIRPSRGWRRKIARRVNGSSGSADLCPGLAEQLFDDVLVDGVVHHHVLTDGVAEGAAEIGGGDGMGERLPVRAQRAKLAARQMFHQHRI